MCKSLRTATNGLSVGELPRYVRGGATTPQCASLSSFLEQSLFFPRDTMPKRYMHAMTLCLCASVHPPVTSRFSGRPLVNRSLCAIGPLSVCPVCNIGVFVVKRVDKDGTCYGRRPRLRPYYVKWGHSCPTETGTAAPHFRSMSIVVKRSPISATAELLFI